MSRSGVARLITGAAAALLVAGCGQEGDGAGPTSSTVPTTATTATTATSAGSDPTTDEGVADPGVELAEWQTIELTDADGEMFALSDLLGRPVFVESFATWCTNCRDQLGDTDEAAERAGDEAEFVALSVETELDADDMAAYARDQGFAHIRFAVMSPEMLGAFNDAFGNSALNPPSTPHVSVSADGVPGSLVTGYEGPDEILTSLGLG